MIFLLSQKNAPLSLLSGGRRYVGTKKERANHWVGDSLTDSVGLPGLEPGKAGPESAVLPLHHSPRKPHLLLIAMQRYRVFSVAANLSAKKN